MLLLEIVGNISEIELNARASNHDLILSVVLNRLTSIAPVVVGAKLKSIREEIVRLKDEILDDQVNHRVRDFNARNWDISSVLKDRRDDNLSEIFDEMRLEGWLSLFVSTKVEE